MQADNLRPVDVQKMKDFFEKEIKRENPDALLRILEEKGKEKEKDLPRDCLFKDHCKANKPFWKRIFLLKKRSPR